MVCIAENQEKMLLSFRTFGEEVFTPENVSQWTRDQGLPDEVVKLLVSGFISAGHGRALLGLKNREEMLPLAERIVAQELSVRDVESIVRSINKKKPDLGDLVDGPIKVDYNAELEQRFTNVTGRRCKITNTGKKKNIKIEFADDEDLCDILKKLAGNDFFENY